MPASWALGGGKRTRGEEQDAADKHAQPGRRGRVRQQRRSPQRRLRERPAESGHSGSAQPQPPPELEDALDEPAAGAPEEALAVMAAPPGETSHHLAPKLLLP
jgi:hypothetical protein